ncbi:AMP-dependent synthetase/ligase [Candidatus Uabimicrobium amorphum]|uniref:Long-chain-fatty-acid--CoA ligase n=1 Tax=Uabimicrobium amorphum TaxID=2596890 RepID=A0A5S9INZ9_UABAM|nr:long-chain fatty acid--CoA ligase [Candidatus Uabimicrobium amorphum]BBM85423.1 long-chain-fatty-acid--CoA ligase [Candidatus Uabimicrobium amorphum]
MQYQNIYQMLCATVERCAETASYFHKVDDDWQTVTWKEFKDLADNFALALLKQGLQPGDTVSILAGNDLVWPVADVGTIAAGGIGVGIYPSSSPEQCAYILKHSNSKFVVVDTEPQLQKILQIREQIPGLTIISKIANENAISWEEFLQQGDRGAWEAYQETAMSRGYDDTVVIVYTSGTTGHPKGACLSNRYVIASCVALDKVFEAVRSDTFIENADDQFVTLSFLPFCHVAERISGMYARMYSGFSAYLIDNIAKLFSYMQELSPHMFGGLPRFYEKIYAKILDDVENGKINKQDFDKAMDINKRVIAQRDDNQTLTAELYEEWKWAEEHVYSKVRSSFGSRIVSCSSGAAPIPKEVLDLFLYAGNLTILEAYGLTEYVCCAFSTPRAHRANSVGKPMHGCEVKIAEDGEILLKGPQMFTGYYNDEKATKEVIDDDGWLHTGDIGKLDEDNFLYITGRKKEFIKTSTGKKIAPLYIENLCKRNHLLSNIMVYGDNKKYLTALITLNEVELRSYAKVHNLEFDSYADLTKHPKIQEIVAEVIAEVNAQVSRTEQIKKYTVLEKDFSIEGDEITPTGKVKRRIVNKKYHDVIESMYV